MRSQIDTVLGLSLLTLLFGLAVACGISATATPVVGEQEAVGEVVPGLAAPGIVNPGNLGWPRLVEGKNGVIEIADKPQRVLAPSLGHSEILVALVETSRIVGISHHAYNPDYSNIVGIAETTPGREVQSDAEVIVSLDPDLVIDSAFAKSAFVEQLEATGITVVQTQFDDSIDAIRDNIRLIAYMLGEEERGERLVRQIEERIQLVSDTIGRVPEEEKPRVLMLGFESIWAGGAGTYSDDTITRAGGINLPSREFEGFKKIGAESIVAMNPEILFLESTEVRDNDALNVFLNNPALAEVDAIKNHRVYPVERTYLTNLSHWHVLGLEEIAKVLYPDKFAGVEFPDLVIEVNVAGD